MNLFWDKVDKNGGPDTCWGWLGARSYNSAHYGGYGNFWFKHKVRKAHRVAWELAFGEIPAGLKVLHHCDNPPCVNPAHLFLGTHMDNARDKERKGRGGQLSGENHSGVKLTWTKVRTIRSLYATGDVSQKVLALSFNIGSSQISRIVRHEHWKEAA